MKGISKTLKRWIVFMMVAVLTLTSSGITVLAEEIATDSETAIEAEAEYVDTVQEDASIAAEAIEVEQSDSGQETGTTDIEAPLVEDAVAVEAQLHLHPVSPLSLPE